jgi:DNA-binding transcriptional regulator YdaS (Cro superfamily)
MAAAVGVSRGYFSELVGGTKRPSLELAVAIERATGGAVLATSWVPEPWSEDSEPTSDDRQVSGPKSAQSERAA